MSALGPLPPLPLDEWQETKDTLHLWAQILGKIKLDLAPMRNHWWNVTLRPSARGITTGRLPGSAHNLEVELNLIDSRLDARTTTGLQSFALTDGLSVSEFYEQTVAALDTLDVDVDILARPFGVPMDTPFLDDAEHHRYDPSAARRYLGALQWSADVLEEFAGWYDGKASPVQLFWHSFDLAHSRYSGRRSTAAAAADPVTAEAYSREVISFGFWPGDERTRFPAYYSYTAPEPPGLTERPLPPGARWVEQATGSLAIVAYDDIRGATDPKAALLDFLQRAFEAGAVLADWDLVDTTTAWCPVPESHIAQLTDSLHDSSQRPEFDGGSEPTEG